jgi:hypothetical protein
MLGAAASPWNSLEVVKLVVAALTPLFVAAVGFWLNKRLKSLEAAQWAQQKVVERRIKAYDDLAPSLNQLYCFFAYVGSWKDIEPPALVALKRSLDRDAHISAPLFDPDFLRLYNELLDSCFTTFVGWGQDAKLRTLPDRRREAAGTSWTEAWDPYFADRKDATEPSKVKTTYTMLMAYLARAMGATEVDAHILGAGAIPANFDMGAVNVVSRTPPDEEVAPNRGGR